jgi:hypothetical protein
MTWLWFAVLRIGSRLGSGGWLFLGVFCLFSGMLLSTLSESIDRHCQFNVMQASKSECQESRVKSSPSRCISLLLLLLSWLACFGKKNEMKRRYPFLFSSLFYLSSFMFECVQYVQRTDENTDMKMANGEITTERRRKKEQTFGLG